MSGLWTTNQKMRCESYGRALARLCTDLDRDLSYRAPAQVAAHWYAIQTKYRVEKRVTTELSKKGFDTFAPVLQEIHRWSDRSKRINIPLFSGYLFVHTNLSRETRTRVLRTPGVLRFVEFAGAAAPVPSKQIEDLQALLQDNIACSLHAFLKVGRRVRIRGGCLDGMEGILEHTGEKKLVISIDCIERSVAVQIEGYELELA
jgi:transcription termination/antitermination protein NusG